MEVKYTLEDVAKTAEQLITSCKTKLILLHGEMGVGKTTLVKHIAKSLGCKDTISSPTYALVNEYELSDGLLYHFDLYRVNSEEELYDFGIEDYLHSGEWIVIEWPELVQHMLPPTFDTVYLSELQDNSRQLRLKTKE